MKAVKDFEAVTKLYPKDADAKVKLKSAKEFCMRDAIHKSNEDEEVSLNPDDQNVSDSYDGPVIEDNKITFNFCNKLADYMKKQNKLHVKYLIILLNLGIEFLKNKRSIVQDVNVENGNKITICGDTHGQ